MTNTLDRYIAMADEVVRDPERFDEWMTLFAPDAVVRIGPEPVRGHHAVVEFYRQHVAQFAESTHYWNTTVLDDGRLRGQWACAFRTADGSVSVVAGVEHATVDDAGRILTLDNEFTVPPS